MAPGQNDLVAITPGYGVTDIVTGVGDAASLTLGGYGGAVDIKGQLSTGAASFQAGEYASALIDVGASLTDSEDAAGNVSAPSARLNFTVDVTPPAAPTLSDASIVDGTVNAANDTAAQVLAGTAPAGDTINAYLNGSTTPAFITTADPVTGDWSVTLGQLANGSYAMRRRRRMRQATRARRARR